MKLAIPAVVAQVINLLYNIVDRIYIGHIPVVGTSALTGVGLCLPLLMLINAFASMAGIFALGFQISCQQTFVALGQAKTSLLLACLRKLVLLIPLIFILPLFFENKVFAVFLAEPISDIAAAMVTTSCFFTKIRSILENGGTENGDNGAI